MNMTLFIQYNLLDCHIHTGLDDGLSRIHRVQRNIWGVSNAPTGVSVFRRFNIGRGDFISSFSKKEPLFGKTYYCTEGRDNKGFLLYRQSR